VEFNNQALFSLFGRPNQQRRETKMAKSSLADLEDGWATVG
jgi:hypothetical protein